MAPGVAAAVGPDGARLKTLAGLATGPFGSIRM